MRHSCAKGMCEKQIEDGHKHSSRYMNIYVNFSVAKLLVKKKKEACIPSALIFQSVALVENNGSSVISSDLNSEN